MTVLGANATQTPGIVRLGWHEPDGSPLWSASQTGSAQVHYAGAPSPLTFAWANLASALDRDAQLLSEAELVRARVIDDPARRARFIAGRTFVRRTLGARIDGEPYLGEFVVDRLGKPGLPPPHASLGFNVSHAGDLIVVAIREDGPIGVDIERCDRAIPPKLADIVFDRDERDCLSRCDDWRTAFLLGWTCKEAVLKCVGCGLLRDPRRIKVFIDNDGVRHSVAYEYSARGELIGNYRIISQPWGLGMLGVMAVSCA